MKIKEKKTRGFTIIEALVVLFIFALITVTFYSLFSVGTKYIIESKYRLGAVAVANERMEMIRSLNYSEIGTTEGYINGDIPSFDQVTIDNRTFFIFTNVIYIDDAYDGTEDGTPDDAIPTDYKRVTVKTAWENDVNSSRAISLVSDFAPPGVEGSMGGGTLVIKVINKDSVGIQNFSVNIKNTSLGINENFVTDSNGGISLPGAVADGNNYEISISKTNYFSIITLPPYPTTSYYPVYAHASVTEGSKNIYSITTDEVSNVVLKTEDPLGSVVPNISFNLKGGMRKGNTIDDPPDNPSAPIFYFDQNLNSGSNGENTLGNISYGSYDFTPNVSGGDYEFIKMFPFDATLNDKAKFSVEPGSDFTQKAIFANKNMNSVLITVLDSSSSLPVQNASVRLYNLSLPDPYDVTLSTDDFGMIYFPNNLPELAVGNYNIDVTSSGYQNKTEPVTINAYTKKEINIDPT